jgi:hypothetical protein
MTMTETVETTSRKQVAKHYLLDAQGNVTEDEMQATGIRYVQLSTNDTFDYQVSETAKLALAVFGSKTLATNEASQVRNNPKGGGSDAEQMAAIRDRFTKLDAGEWVDRTREVAPPNLDAMAEAAIVVMLADSKIAADQVGDIKAKVRQKLDDDPKYLTVLRNHPRIPGEYAKLIGRQVKTTDDLLAGISTD